MSMLADPRRKQKISADPRNLNWHNDKEKFGHKLMEKMGWTSGKGLGAKQDGNVDFIKVSLKSDTRGVGCSRSHADNWIAHQDDFNSLLANLNAVGGGAAKGSTETGYGSDPEPVRLQKLAEKSKTSRGRVPYVKFAKGKDLSMKTNEDLACIFGQRKSKSAPVTPQTRSEVNSEDEQSEEKSEKVEAESGINTFTSGTSVKDYFAKKMAELKRSRAANYGFYGNAARDENSSDVDEPRSGFGFGAPSTNFAPSSENSRETTTEEKDNDSSEESTSKKKKKKSKKSKRKAEEMEEESGEGAQVEEEEESNPPKKSKKEKKNREKEEVVVEAVAEESSSSSEEPPKKKKKKKSKEQDADSAPASPLEVESEEKLTKKEKKAKKKKRKDNDSDDQETESMVVEETEETVSKKEKKSKNKNTEKEADITEDGNQESSKTKISKSDLKKNDAAQYLKSLAKDTNPAFQSHTVDASNVVLKWDPKKKTKQKKESSDSAFSGSNFTDIKGYGHGYSQSLTLMPVSKKKKTKK